MTEKDSNKYSVSGNEKEVLPNKLGLTKKEEIDAAEFSGFLTAQIFLIQEIGEKTKFTVKYLHQIHKLALGDLYSFAGNLRTVNMSKGGFIFPASRFLPEAMDVFEKEMLLKLSNPYDDREQFTRDLARSHAELVYLHPYREGNGRTARLLASLIYLKQTGKHVNFSSILRERMDVYIKAVQQASKQEYGLMEALFSEALK